MTSPSATKIAPGTSPVKTYPEALTGAIAAFLEAKQGAGLSPKTLLNYQQELDRFSNFTGEKPVTKVAPKDISCYLSKCRARGISPNTVCSYYRTLRSFFNWCQHQGLIKHSPTDKLESPKEEKKVVRPFTPEEITRLTEVLDSTQDRFLATRNVALLFLLLDTGLRISEALSLKLEQLNESAVVNVMGKGSKERWVRLSPEVLQALASYMGHRNRLPARKRCSALITTWDRQPLKPQGFRTALKDAGKVLGWTHVRVSPHTLRNTYGCWTAIGGMDSESIRISMGHSSQAMTAKYIEFAATKRALLEHEKFSPVKLMAAGMDLGMAPVPEALPTGVA